MDNRKKAVTLMIISAFAFSIMSAMVKLSGDIPIYEKVFFRNLVGLIIAYSMIRNRKISLLGKRENQKYLFSRSILGLLGVVLNFYALQYLVLSDANILNKLSPFFVIVFAILFLRERIKKLHIPALIIVFIGALLIIKPQFNFSVIPSLAGFLSAIFAGAAYTVIRFLNGRERPETIVFYFTFISVVAMLPMMILNYQKPTVIQFVFLIGTGVFAAIDQFALTNAYRYAPAGEVSIYNYISIIFSAIIGFIIWMEVPDFLSIVGTLIITAVAILMYVYNNKNVFNKPI